MSRIRPRIILNVPEKDTKDVAVQIEHHVVSSTKMSILEKEENIPVNFKQRTAYEILRSIEDP